MLTSALAASHELNARLAAAAPGWTSLVRPDGHLAWAADHATTPDAAGAAAALRRWWPGGQTASR
jgi:hypothetical protein